MKDYSFRTPFRRARISLEEVNSSARFSGKAAMKDARFASRPKSALPKDLDSIVTEPLPDARGKGTASVSENAENVCRDSYFGQSLSKQRPLGSTSRSDHRDVPTRG
jgi:hypothetical protein